MSTHKLVFGNKIWIIFFNFEIYRNEWTKQILWSNFEFHISFSLQSFFDMGHFGWMIFHSMCRNGWIETKRFTTKLANIRISFATMNIGMFLQPKKNIHDFLDRDTFSSIYVSLKHVSCLTLNFVLLRNPLPQITHLYLSFHASECIVRWVRKALRLADTFPHIPHVWGPV